MKEKIHPKYNVSAKVICLSCGTEFDFGSTKEEYSVAICSHCHPFYTGESQALIDSSNKISSFKEKLSKTQDLQKKLQEIKKQREDRQKSRVGVIAQQKEKGNSLKDLLAAAKGKK